MSKILPVLLDVIFTVLAVCYAIIGLGAEGSEAREYFTLALGCWIISELYSNKWTGGN